MGQDGNNSFKDCQRFGLKKVFTKTIPIRDSMGEKRILVVFSIIHIVSCSSYSLFFFLSTAEIAVQQIKIIHSININFLVLI